MLGYFFKVTKKTNHNLFFCALLLIWLIYLRKYGNIFLKKVIKQMKKNIDFTVLNFIAQCNEFVEGKFLFASQKLENLYQKILESPALVELFLQCSEDFKYSLEMTKAFIKTPTKAGTFTPPKEPDKFLALIFGLLKEINEKTVNFNVFVPKYFSEDAKIPPTQAFANQVILPLKSTVAKYFEVDENNKQHFSKEEIEKNKENQEKSDLEKEQNQAQLENNEKIEENQENEQVAQIKAMTDVEEIENEPVIISTFEEEIKSYKITYEDLMEALNLNLKQMQTKLKSMFKIKNEIKTDALFVIARALSFVNLNDINSLYSELISIKYMKRHLRFLKTEINEIFEIFAYFEKL